MKECYDTWLHQQACAFQRKEKKSKSVASSYIFQSPNYLIQRKLPSGWVNTQRDCLYTTKTKFTQLHQFCLLPGCIYLYKRMHSLMWKKKTTADRHIKHPFLQCPKSEIVFLKITACDNSFNIPPWYGLLLHITIFVTSFMNSTLFLTVWRTAPYKNYYCHLTSTLSVKLFIMDCGMAERKSLLCRQKCIGRSVKKNIKTNANHSGQYNS